MNASGDGAQIELADLLEAFAVGDYASVIEQTDRILGPQIIIELARIRLIALQRLEQTRSVKSFGRSLVYSLEEQDSFQKSLIQLLLGEASPVDAMALASTKLEKCQFIYCTAARLRTEHGFDAAKQKLTECAALQLVCVETWLARRELELASNREPEQDETWQVGDVIGGTFEVRKVIEDGAMSLVYLVHHKGWDIDVALKIPRSKVMTGANAWGRLITEANTWVDLGLHPNIVSAFYVRRIKGIPAIVMEKVDGGSLSRKLESTQLLEMPVVVDIAVQVARGLDYAARVLPGFVHRDIKPANVLMTSDGIAKISDFGLANATSNATSNAAGTPAYMAPEVWLQSHQVDSSSDVYSFGCLLFELLTKRRPFDQSVYPSPQEPLPPTELMTENANTRTGPATTQDWAPEREQHAPRRVDRLRELMEAHVEGPVPNPRELNPEIPESLNALCRRMLQKSPADRPSFQQIADELLSIYSDMSGAEYPRPKQKMGGVEIGSLNNRALSMLDLGRREQACAIWERARELDPLDPPTVFNSGLFAWRKGNITESDLLEELENLQSASSDVSLLSYLKALVQAEAGNRDAAIALLAGVDDASVFADSSSIAHTRSRIGRIDSRNRNIAGHADVITDVCINDSGIRILTASRDRTVRSLEGADENASTVICEHAHPVVAMNVSDDWGTIATLDADGTLVISKFRQQTSEITIHTQTKMTGFVQLDDSGEVCLVCGRTSEATLWDTVKGHQTAKLKDSYGVTAGYVSSVHGLVIAADSNSMGIWRLDDGDCVDRWPLDHSPILRRPFALSSRGESYAFVLGNVDIQLTATASNQPLKLFRGHKDGVQNIAIARNAPRMVSSDFDGKIRLWDIHSGRCLRTLSFDSACISALAISGDGRRTVVGAESGDVFLIDSPDRTFTASFILSRPVDSVRLAQRQKMVNESVSSATGEVQGGRFAMAAGIIRQARARAGCNRNPELLAVWFRLYKHLQKTSLCGLWKLRVVEGHDTYVRSIRHVGAHGYLLSCSHNGQVCLHGQNEGQPTTSPTEEFKGADSSMQDAFLLSGEIGRVAWAVDASRDGNVCAAASYSQQPTDGTSQPFLDGCIHVWETQTGKCLRRIEVGNEAILSLSFCNGDKQLAAGLANGLIALFSVETGEKNATLEGHLDAVTALTGFQQGFLVSTGEDQFIRLWRVENAECLRAFGADESGPMVTAKKFLEMSLEFGLESPAESGHRNLVKPLLDIMHKPVRLRAKRALAICSDKSGTVLLRAIGRALEIWDIKQCELRSTFDAHADVILDADMTDDGRFAATAGADRCVRLWHLESGQCMHSAVTTDAPHSIRFGPDGKSLFVGEFGVISEWTLDWELSGDRPSDTSQTSVTDPDPAIVVELVNSVDQYLANELESEAQFTRLKRTPSNHFLQARSRLISRIPQLIERIVSAKCEAVRDSASWLLSCMGGHAVAPLLKLLDEPDVNLRKSVMAALGQLGVTAEPAIPRLIQLSRAFDQDVALSAGSALFNIGTASIPPLAKLLDLQDTHPRRVALYTLVQFGPLARPAVPAITRAADRTNDPQFRQAARQALVQILNSDPRSSGAATEEVRARFRIGPWLKVLSFVLLVFWLVIALLVGPTGPSTNAWAYHLGGWLIIAAIFSFILGFITK